MKKTVYAVSLMLILFLSACSHASPLLEYSADGQPGDNQLISQEQETEGLGATLGASEPVLGAAASDADPDKITTLSYINVPQSGGLLQAGNADGATTYVGLGYNVLDSTYINPEGFSLGRHILNAEEVEKRLKTAKAPLQSSYTIMGETVKTYSDDLTAKLKLKSDYPLFSGSLESEFDKSQTKKSNVFFIKSMSGYPKYSEYIDITDDLTTILDPTFKKNLDGSMKPKELFETYGTHLVVEALMGARCTYNYTYSATSTMTKTQVQAKVDATYRFISGEGSSSDKQVASEFLSNSAFQSMLSGGADVDASTLDSLLKNFPKWVDSLAAATPTIYGISNMNSLIPVWKLTTDADRANDLENYYKERGGSIQKLLDSMSVIPKPTPAPQVYIQSIVITSDKDYDVATNQKQYPGYTLLGKDLNKDAGGDFIYIWYDTTDDSAQALTDIRITYGNTSLSSSYTKNPHDLNKGAGGEFIYLWTSNNASNGKPIKDLRVFFGENADMPTGYTVVTYNDSGKAADLNKGAGGAYIYLGIKR